MRSRLKWFCGCFGLILAPEPRSAVIPKCTGRRGGCRRGRPDRGYGVAIPAAHAPARTHSAPAASNARVLAAPMVAVQKAACVRKVLLPVRWWLWVRGQACSAGVALTTEIRPESLDQHVEYGPAPVRATRLGLGCIPDNRAQPSLRTTFTLSLGVRRTTF